MNSHSLGAAVQRLRDALGGPAGSDAALLDRFAANGDPAAFAGLVARYGPMVLGLCRRTIGDPHLAEDVFQAVFLVLARKAGSIRKRDAVGSWLYGVAYRLGRKAASRERKRPEFVKSQSTPVAYAPGSPVDAAAWNELLAALDEELHRLPDQLRAPLLLCYYDGCTQDEAAGRLGWSLGTLRRRLQQARDRLHARLTARGASLGAGLLATVLTTRGARAAVPLILRRLTVQAVETFASGGQVAGPVAQLVEEGLRMLAATKVRASVALMVLVGGLAAGTGALFGVGRDQPGAQNQSPVAHAPGSPDPSLPAGVVMRHGGAPFRDGAEIINILVAPDGKTILTQDTRTIRIWDAVTGQNPGNLELAGDGPGFWTGALTPDGKTVITTRHNGTAQVWDLAGRKMTRSFYMAAPPFDVSEATCAYSPDGRAIAVVTGDGSLRVCDVTACKEMEQLRSHSDGVKAAAFTSDSKTLVLACDDGSLRKWDVASGAETFKWPAPTHVVDLCLAPYGDLIALLVQDPSKQGEQQPDPYIDLWSWTAGTVRGLRNPPNGPTGPMFVAFSPDGAFLFAPGKQSDGKILLQWDVKTGRNMRQFPAHQEAIGAIAFTPDGHTLITADTALRFWDWTSGRELRRAADGGGQHSYVLTPDGRAVVEADMTSTIRIWDAASGKELRRLETPRPTPDAAARIAALAISPDGRFLAARGGAPTEGWDGNPYIWIWDLTTGALLHRLIDAEGISMMTFSSDGRTLSSAAPSRPVVSWDVATGRAIADNQLPKLQPMQLDYSADGKRVYIWDKQGNFICRDVARNVDVSFDLTKRRGDSVKDLIWSANRKWIAAIPNESAFIRVLEEGTDNSPGQLQIAPRTYSFAALANDGKTLAVAPNGENPPVLVYDVATGRELKRFTGLHGRAAWLAFAPDCQRLYAASSDTTVLAWEVR